MCFRHLDWWPEQVICREKKADILSAYQGEHAAHLPALDLVLGLAPVDGEEGAAQGLEGDLVALIVGLAQRVELVH